MGPADPIVFSRRVVTGAGTGPATVVCRAGQIAEVIPGEGGRPRATIDLADLALLPGLVDTHVHVNEPGRTDWEGFATAGRAAAAGGITSIVVMPLNCDPVVTRVGALEEEARAAGAACLVDHGFWGGVVPGNENELGALWDTGVLGLKCFMVHSGIDEFPDVTEADLRRAMAVLARLGPSGAVLLAHAEDAAVIGAARATSGLDASPRSYAAYLASRPEDAEVRAVETLVRLCREHRTPVHVVHVSAAGALRALAGARREGLPITTETCPHYLSLASDEIADGATVFKCAPPIRDRFNRAALWTGLRTGTLDLIASDHSPCPPGLKRLDTGDFGAAWGGIASLQLGLPVVWTEARRRGFALADVARWMSLAPARLAGLDHRKGRIAPGFDADLVAFDPEAEFTVRAQDLQHRHKTTPYDHRTLRGVVRTTILRGRVIFDGAADSESRFPVGETGQWLKRRDQRPPHPTSRS